MSLDADLTDSCVVRTFASRIQTPSIEVASKESFLENSVFIRLRCTKEILRKLDPGFKLRAPDFLWSSSQRDKILSLIFSISTNQGSADTHASKKASRQFFLLDSSLREREYLHELIHHRDTRTQCDVFCKKIILKY